MKASGQLRLGGMGGVAGLDFGAVQAMAVNLGYNLATLTELYPFAEQGLVKAMNRKGED